MKGGNMLRFIAFTLFLLGLVTAALAEDQEAVQRFNNNKILDNLDLVELDQDKDDDGDTLDVRDLQKEDKPDDEDQLDDEDLQKDEDTPGGQKDTMEIDDDGDESVDGDRAGTENDGDVEDSGQASDGDNNLEPQFVDVEDSVEEGDPIWFRGGYRRFGGFRRFRRYRFRRGIRRFRRYRFRRGIRRFRRYRFRRGIRRFRRYRFRRGIRRIRRYIRRTPAARRLRRFIRKTKPRLRRYRRNFRRIFRRFRRNRIFRRIRRNRVFRRFRRNRIFRRFRRNRKFRRFRRKHYRTRRIGKRLKGIYNRVRNFLKRVGKKGNGKISWLKKYGRAIANILKNVLQKRLEGSGPTGGEGGTGPTGGEGGTSPTGGESGPQPTQGPPYRFLNLKFENKLNVEVTVIPSQSNVAELAVPPRSSKQLHYIEDNIGPRKAISFVALDMSKTTVTPLLLNKKFSLVFLPIYNNKTLVNVKVTTLAADELEKADEISYGTDNSVDHDFDKDSEDAYEELGDRNDGDIDLQAEETKYVAEFRQ